MSKKLIKTAQEIAVEKAVKDVVKAGKRGENIYVYIDTEDRDRIMADNGAIWNPELNGWDKIASFQFGSNTEIFFYRGGKISEENRYKMAVTKSDIEGEIWEMLGKI